MPIHLTCVAVETPRAFAFDMGVALRLAAPAGTAVREDPHVTEVLYLEATADAPDAATALVACGLTAAELVTASGLPGEIAEVVVVDGEGVLCWVPTTEALAAREPLASTRDTPTA